MDFLFAAVRPLLHGIDPEAAHALTLKGLALLPPQAPRADDPRLRVEAWGRTFPNPVGLAAGFDKGAEVPDAMLGLGFGFVEVGGVTPKPQPGNPRPRLFRLPRDGAVINRNGFNSEGLEAVRKRLVARRERGAGIVGVNLGANKDSSDRMADYVAGIRGLGPLASFLTINVSSPNTPGLRDLQGEAFLDELLGRCLAARDDMARTGERTPILLKIAPDLDLPSLDAIVATALHRGVDGLIVSNTTVARAPDLKETALAKEAGGLSGRPLFVPSTRLMAETFLRTEGRLPLIGAGGIDSAETAWAKIRAGATLVQLYTALVYGGPGLIGEIKRGLAEKIAAEGLASIPPAIGRDAAAIARGEGL